MWLKEAVERYLIQLECEITEDFLEEAMPQLSI